MYEDEINRKYVKIDEEFKFNLVLKNLANTIANKFLYNFLNKKNYFIGVSPHNSKYYYTADDLRVIFDIEANFPEYTMFMVGKDKFKKIDFTDQETIVKIITHINDIIQSKTKNIKELEISSKKSSSNMVFRFAVLEKKK